LPGRALAQEHRWRTRQEELKARALLKPKLDITQQVDRMMHRLNETRVMVCVTKRLDR
jgi:hypothetical protein